MRVLNHEELDAVVGSISFETGFLLTVFLSAGVSAGITSLIIDSQEQAHMILIAAFAGFALPVFLAKAYLAHAGVNP